MKGRCDNYSDLQSQKAVSAHLKSKQILPFGFARQYSSLLIMCVNCQELEYSSVPLINSCAPWSCLFGYTYVKLGAVAASLWR